MSDQTQDNLWGDDYLAEQLARVVVNYNVTFDASNVIGEILMDMRDTYEQRLAAVSAERDQVRRELNITKATLESTQNRLERVLDRNIENAIRLEELEATNE